MSLVLPPLYHWSPAANRDGINRRGLRPTCPTAAPVGTPIMGPTPEPAMGDPLLGQARQVEADASVLAVCLGVSPSHAWSLSGGIWAERGSMWDLWQVVLDETDAVHPLPFFGRRLDEVRVSNRIPKSRVWLVGQRTVALRGRR